MIIMTKQCVLNKNHVGKSKVYVTVRTFTLYIDFSETCLYPPMTWASMVGFINNVALIILMTRGCVANTNYVASTKS